MQKKIDTSLRTFFETTKAAKQHVVTLRLGAVSNCQNLLGAIRRLNK